MSKDGEASKTLPAGITVDNVMMYSSSLDYIGIDNIGRKGETEELWNGFLEKFPPVEIHFGGFHYKWNNDIAAALNSIFFSVQLLSEKKTRFVHALVNLSSLNIKLNQSWGEKECLKFIAEFTEFTKAYEKILRGRQKHPSRMRKVIKPGCFPKPVPKGELKETFKKMSFLHPELFLAEVEFTPIEGMQDVDTDLDSEELEKSQRHNEELVSSYLEEVEVQSEEGEEYEGDSDEPVEPPPITLLRPRSERIEVALDDRGEAVPSLREEFREEEQVALEVSEHEESKEFEDGEQEVLASPTVKAPLRENEALEAEEKEEIAQDQRNGEGRPGRPLRFSMLNLPNHEDGEGLSHKKENLDFRRDLTFQSPHCYSSRTLNNFNNIPASMNTDYSNSIEAQILAKKALDLHVAREAKALELQELEKRELERREAASRELERMQQEFNKLKVEPEIEAGDYTRFQRSFRAPEPEVRQQSTVVKNPPASFQRIANAKPPADFSAKVQDGAGAFDHIKRWDHFLAATGIEDNVSLVLAHMEPTFSSSPEGKAWMAQVKVKRNLSWKEIRKSFIKRFVADEDDAKYEFRKRKIAKGESPASFLQRMQMYAEVAGLDTIEGFDKLLVRQFCLGMCSSASYTFLSSYHMFQDLNEVIERLTEAELWEKKIESAEIFTPSTTNCSLTQYPLNPKPKTVPKSVYVQQVEMDEDELSMQYEMAVQEGGALPPKPGKKFDLKDLKCHLCGGPNHTSAYCPKGCRTCVGYKLKQNSIVRHHLREEDCPFDRPGIQAGIDQLLNQHLN